MGKLLTSCLVLMLAVPVLADEGMWLPNQLPMIGQALEAAGLDTPPADFADLTGDPMGAIVSLGGCSASFVSKQGLVATNHHCAYGTIQFNSTPEKNLLENGFVARSPEDELQAAPGARVYVTLAVSGVTDEILAKVPDDADGAARFSAIENAEKELIAGCEKSPGHRCRVASFHGGLQFRLYDQLEIRDVRLAYAPPSSIGKYGGDIDNWMWPRHTGDFSIYRAYVGPDGLPAEPSPDNVPFQPKHWLQIGRDGVDVGDFVMVVGFPGRTNRYRLASEVDEVITWSYPRRIKRYQEMLDIIARETEGRTEAQIAYAGLISGLNNGLKNNQGMLAGFAHSQSVQRKQALEVELAAWIAADPEREARWGAAVSELESILDKQRDHRERDEALSSIKWNQLLSTTSRAYRLARESEKPNTERKMGYQERDLPRIRARIERSARTYDAQVDMALLRRALERYAELPASERVPALDDWFGLDGELETAEAIAGTLHSMYMTTDLADSSERLALLDLDRVALEASEDPFVRLAVALYPTWIEMEEVEEALDGRLLEARPRFMEALLAFETARGTEIYADANGTLRATFGNVIGYTPQEAVIYLPFTTAEGVAAKATGEEPFDAPQPLLDAIAAADYGPYSSESVGSLPVCFLSDVDTTGGNSGSATLDSKGRLVGLLFDGNWESMISDWDFLTDVTRSIHVDVRYMLWVMDRIDGAGNLLREMGIEPSFAAGSGP